MRFEHVESEMHEVFTRPSPVGCRRVGRGQALLQTGDGALGMLVLVVAVGMQEFVG